MHIVPAAAARRPPPAPRAPLAPRAIGVSLPLRLLRTALARLRTEGPLGLLALAVSAVSLTYPLGPDQGPTAKYFKRDVASAKKLLADAGFANGLNVPMISTVDAYGNVFNDGLQLVINRAADPVPAGQGVPALHPTENPGDRP